MSEAHKNISKDIKLISFKKNNVIYKQGDYGDSFFYILSGTVDIFVNKNKNEDVDLLNFNESVKEVFFILLKLKKNYFC